MTITFRVEDSHDIDMPLPVPIEPWQMGALREVLAENGERLGTDLIVPDHGSIDAPVFAWEARTAILAVAAIVLIRQNFPAQMRNERFFQGFLVHGAGELGRHSHLPMTFHNFSHMETQ